MTDQDGGGLGTQEILYVSWGGTGRAATVREAMLRAGAAGRGLAYLAILDDSAFGDIDTVMLELAREELAWLLEAQLDLTRSQADLGDLSVRVVVRTGDVVDRICEEVQKTGGTEILIGAPGPLAQHDRVAELVEAVRSRVPGSVDVIEP